MIREAKLLGHPVHPMLIVFPLGLLPTSLLFDVIGLVSHNGYWHGIAFWMMAAGILGGLAAMIPGLIDWLAIPAPSRAKRIGLWHAMTNAGVLVLFAVSWIARYRMPTQPDGTALLFSLLGVGLSLIGGWLGGELVDRLAIGVDAGAHSNSPSSLSNRSAKEQAAPGKWLELWGNRPRSEKSL